MAVPHLTNCPPPPPRVAFTSRRPRQGSQTLSPRDANSGGCQHPSVVRCQERGASYERVHKRIKVQRFFLPPAHAQTSSMLQEGKEKAAGLYILQQTCPQNPIWQIHCYRATCSQHCVRHWNLMGLQQLLLFRNNIKKYISPLVLSEAEVVPAGKLGRLKHKAIDRHEPSKVQTTGEQTIGCQYIILNFRRQASAHAHKWTSDRKMTCKQGP